MSTILTILTIMTISIIDGSAINSSANAAAAGVQNSQRVGSGLVDPVDIKDFVSP